MDQYAVLSSFFFRAYAILGRVIRPFLRRNKRLREGWTERRAFQGWCSRVDVWIQAASGGEAHLALSILHCLPQDAAIRFLLCTWTTQGKEVLEKGVADLQVSHPNLSCQIRMAPLDEPAIAKRALEQASPSLLILLETELWPGLLGACAELGIPVHIFNARMSKASFELYRIIAPILQSLPVTKVHAITRADADRFAHIFGKGKDIPCTVDVMPNIKFDRAAAALAKPPALELLPLFGQARPIILLASVRQQEEHHLGPIVRKLFPLYPDGIIVVAPRHMHRVDAWKGRLHDLGMCPVLASSREEGGVFESGSVVVWDIFGDLPKLYAVADSVFVGGSLGLGGQNFLEALAAGVIPCVGASLENFRWALGEERPPTLIDTGLLRVCRVSRCLQDNLIETATTPTNREEVRSRFLDWLQPHTGGSHAAATYLVHELEKAQ